LFQREEEALHFVITRDRSTRGGSSGEGSAVVAVQARNEVLEGVNSKRGVHNRDRRNQEGRSVENFASALTSEGGASAESVS